MPLYRWGTKSISEQRTDLGIVRSSGVGDSVEIMLPTAQQDIDMAYDEALMALKTVRGTARYTYRRR